MNLSKTIFVELKLQYRFVGSVDVGPYIKEDRIGIILGSLIGFSVLGIIIFPQGATSLLHMIFDYSAFVLNVIIILYYSINLVKCLVNR